MTRYSGRVFYIEEPIIHQFPDDHEVARPAPNVWVITPRIAAVNGHKSPEEHLEFLLDDVLNSYQVSSYLCWYYSPMALKFSRHLTPIVTIYDCMDELSAFKFASPELKQLEVELMAIADVVFTGGNKLFEAKKKFHHNMYAFPSSIDKHHFIRARQEVDDPSDQSAIPHPRLGFFWCVR